MHELTVFPSASKVLEDVVAILNKAWKNKDGHFHSVIKFCIFVRGIVYSTILQSKTNSDTVRMLM